MNDETTLRHKTVTVSSAIVVSALGKGQARAAVSQLNVSLKCDSERALWSKEMPSSLS